MTQTTLSSLPQEWQAWITENLERNCSPDTISELMIRDGQFGKAIADAAIEEARKAKAPANRIGIRPEIDISSNTIQTPDRTIQVLMTCTTPRIVLLGNVLSDEECDELLGYTEQRLTRSPVVGDEKGDTRLHSHRTSRGAMLDKSETELIGRIDARLAALARWPIENAEGLQVLRYEKGNEYRAHYDWFDPSLPGPRKNLERGGQRVGTFVLYMSDVEEGGGTAFPGLGMEIQPRKGNAVFFANTDVYGIPDRATLHAGLPVIKGVKFIANKWLRESAY